MVPAIAFSCQTPQSLNFDQLNLYELWCSQKFKAVCIPSCYQIALFCMHCRKIICGDGQFLLSQPGVNYILSERFCQDPLEVFFGK